MFRFYYLIFLCFVSGLLCSSSLDAGTLIPVTSEHRNSIAEKNHFVTVVVNNQVAVTRVTQTFTNRSQVDLEAMYQFTLPSGARIHSFAMWIKDRKMYGAIVEKNRGREIYEKIVRDKIDPALLEHVSGNTYKIRVFPVQAGKEQRIELAYWQVLPYDSGTVSYLYPLKEGQRNSDPVNFAFSIKIISAIPISTVACETHRISKNQQDAHLVTAGFEDTKTLFDRDLKLVYVLEKKKLGLDVICYRPDQGKDGYFMALVTPPETQEKVVAKAITFVLDISGSMAGEKLEQAKNALSQLVNSLRHEDLFNLIAFETSVRSFAKELLPASIDNKKNALRFISQLASSGSTNLYEALQMALSSHPSSNIPHVVVVLTDGRPTIGETQPKVIMEGTKKLCTEGTRLFTFGVGSDVDQDLLEALARENKGTSLSIRSGENLEMPVSLFFKKIANPVLTQIKLDFQDAGVSRVFPRAITELFQGTQMLITGRYKNPGTFDVKMYGAKQEEKVEVAEKECFPEQEKENEFIARLWASENIDYLLYEVRQGKEDKEVVDEIISLSKTWGIITPYTSYLVLETDEDYKRWGLTTQHSVKDWSKDWVDNSVGPGPKGKIDIKSGKLEYNYSGSRRISFDVLDSRCGMYVQASQILVNGRRISYTDKLPIINTESEVVMKFEEYKTIRMKVKINPGVGPFITLTSLERLKSYEIKLVWGTEIDGTICTVKIFTDGEEVESHHIKTEIFGNTVFLTIYALPDIKDIRLEHDFYYVQTNVTELGKSIKFNRINPTQLITHLKALKPDLALNRIDKIVKEEISKLKDITVAEKDMLIQYVKNDMKNVPDEKRREIIENIK